MADPDGAWGLAIVEVEKEADIQGLTAEAPTIRSRLDFKFEVYAMPIAVLRGVSRT